MLLQSALNDEEDVKVGLLNLTLQNKLLGSPRGVLAGYKSGRCS